jgi:galactokinase
MAHIQKVLETLHTGKADPLLCTLYGDGSEVRQQQVERYAHAIESFRILYPAQTDIDLFSSPGRTEVGGNHTDHNAGHVLAAAVNLDILAVVAKNNANVVHLKSEGYSQDTVMLDQLEPAESEKFRSAALTRGVCSRMKSLGCSIGGFDAYVTSNIPNGAGLSSSAAFEVLIATIENDLYNNGKLSALMRAQIARYSENNFFGKPCGLMDQTACAVGGFVTIDFKDFANPVVKKVNYEFSKSGFTLVIVDSGRSHSDLNEDYAALEHEMKDVARAFGGQVLREFSAEKVLQNMAFLRTAVNDRAILRALHFYAEDQRVLEQVQALEKKDFNEFLRLVIESGYSSWMLCQNCYSPKNVAEQGTSIALTVSESILKGQGAWRVHGGGFAGTIQGFVPNHLLEKYIFEMNKVFGPGACHALMIRPDGAVRLDIEGKK